MLKNKITICLLTCVLVPIVLSAQEVKPNPAFQTFKDTRVINSQSIETLKGGKMDIRIGHRFGNLGGPGGGWGNFYGLESAADVLLGVEYGFSDHVMFGINRTKGTGPLKQNVNGIGKIKFFEQSEKMPFSWAIMGMGSFSTMKQSTSGDVLTSFNKQSHRFSYHTEMILARKFANRFSLQFTGGITHRNVVEANDKNDIYTIGACTRLQVTKAMGLILDIKKPFSSIRNSFNYIPAGAGLEWETGGGHVFQLNVTNARGLSETDYIPYTNDDWTQGEFRLGFTISRLFSI